MPTCPARPPRGLTAAGMAAAVFGLTTWAADPTWAKDAGLDVWNVGRLEDQLRACRAEAARLETQEATLAYLIELNRLIVRDVADGRPLAGAARQLWQANKDRPGFAFALATYFRGPTAEARAADHLVMRVGLDVPLPPAAKARVLVRLRAEYAAAYGVPAP